MRRFNKIRVPYFEELLARYRSEVLRAQSTDKMKIDRRPNPNLAAYVPAATRTRR